MHLGCSDHHSCPGGSHETYFPPPFAGFLAATLAIAILSAKQLSFASGTSSSSAVGELVASPSTLAVNASCEVAASWAESIEPSRYTTLETISELPVVYRRAVYNKLTVDQKITLWRSQFALAAQRGSMTPPQAAFLAAASDSLETWFGADSATRVTNDVRFRAHVFELFGHKLAFELFARLGPEDVIVASSSPAAALHEPNCICATGSDYCGGTNHCTSGKCEVQLSSCGTLWNHNCNGLCYSNQ